MKKTIVLLLTLLFIAACAGQKRTEDHSVKLEYQANSRGYYQMIRVENHMVFVAKNREEKPIGYKINNADWTTINTAIEQLNLDSLTQFKAPTDKRLFDGAASAKLKITKQGKTVESPSFDHGYPPVAIEKIVNKMLSFVK
jgi:PBP1b-binding outer membrane lipoprotein LpoB